MFINDEKIRKSDYEVCRQPRENSKNLRGQYWDLADFESLEQQARAVSSNFSGAKHKALPLCKERQRCEFGWGQGTIWGGGFQYMEKGSGCLGRLQDKANQKYRNGCPLEDGQMAQGCSREQEEKERV